MKLNLKSLVAPLWYRTLYRPFMRLTHRFHWHYAPPSYPDGDTLLRCKWCGFSDIVKRRGDAFKPLSKTNECYRSHTLTRSGGRNPGDGQP